MPLYEDRANAENRISVSEDAKNALIFGTERVIDSISNAIAAHKTPVRVCLDGWYGVDFEQIGTELKSALTKKGIQARFIDAVSLFLPQEEIEEIKKPFITDDPGFGYVNTEGRLQDLMDKDALERCRAALDEEKGVCVVFGLGAMAPVLADSYDLRYYCDMTRQPLLWKMWDGKLVPFGMCAPQQDYSWKAYYYCDYYLLHHQKDFALTKMDAYVEAIETDSLKLVPRGAYDEIIQTLVQYPVKEVKIYQPGPWGAYRYRDLFEVPGLECNAWNELAGPELSILVDVGLEEMLNIPFVALMQYPRELVGSYIDEHFKHLFPMDVWLDDGYFPRPEPAERISMPIHNHPSTDYVKRRFNEPLGRYETYYIAEAYEGANTWMGYADDADLEEWESKCRASDNLRVIENWKDYIANWDSVVGDLYLIPPGTAHGHGGNQMVLEMDTCPSVAGTEYSFFTYDFARNSWDDNTKTMTGKPLKMHLDHSFDNDKYRRESWVKDHLLAKPEVVKWTKEYYLERYASLPEMPFEIERFFFNERAENDTAGLFCNILTLTVGKRVRVQSKAHPERFTEIDLFQSCVVPACFGEYDIINLHEGACTVVQLRWKKG